MSDASDDRTILSGEAVPTQVDGDESYCAACGGSYPLDVDVCPQDGARLTKLKARPDALLGRVFDNRFEVRMALGQGGMGTVYRGWQLTVDREIAIKVIHPKLASDRVAVKRFLREARLSSRLNQPNIINVYDFGQTEDGVLYIAMELLRGHTLAREVEAMRPLPLRRILTIGQQLCDALDAAHGQGIVHRDLKPGNIIILDDPPGRDLIKVLDFGLAKSLVSDTTSLVTNTNAILGTPLYMPPEQIEGRPSDQRADLYSLGCILYQMVSGRPPFLADSVNLVLAAHVSDEPPPLPATTPPELARTIQRLMEKDPAKRMRSAREAREAMQAILEGGPAQVQDDSFTAPDLRPLIDSSRIALAMTDHAGSQPPPSTTATQQPGSPPVRRARWLAPVAIAALAAGAAITYLAMRDARRAPPPSAVEVPAVIDAAPAVASDAEVRDSAIAADAASNERIAPAVDAGKPITRKPAKPAKPTPPKPPAPGSGTDETDLPFLKRPAAR